MFVVLFFRQQVRVQELDPGSPGPDAPSMGEGPASGRRGIFRIEFFFISNET